MNIGTLTVTLMADMTQLDKMTSGLSSMSQKFRTFGYLASTALTLPMVMAGKAAFQMAKDYEFSMQKIVGLAGVAQDAVNKWNQEVLKMGPEVAKSPKELAEALYFIASSGIKGQQALDVLRLSAKAATAGLGETQEVANLLTSVLNAYAGTGITASKATDILVAAVREGKAEASGFASAMGQIIPIAANLGVSFDQVAGGMAAITLSGASASNAAVYLKGIFNSLITASAQGETALKRMGTSYAGLRQVLANQGLMTLLEQLRVLQKKYGDEMLSDVLPNIRAMTGFLSLAGKNFQYNSEVMKKVEQSTGSLGKAFAAVAETIKVKYDTALSAAQGSLISLGKSIATALLPLLETLVKKLAELTTWFNSLSEAQKQHKLVMLGVIAALGPLSLILSLIGYAISGLITVVKGAIVAFNFLRITMLANPYLLIGLAIGLIAGGLIKLISSTDNAKDAQNGFNSALVKVEGTMKRLKDLTATDFSTMNFMSLEGVKTEAIKQKELAFINIKGAVERAGKTMAQFYAGERMGVLYQKYIDSQVDAWNSAKGAINETDKALEILGNSFIDNANKSSGSTKTVINNYKKIQEEITKAHKLLLEEYDAQLKKENKVLDFQDRMRELQSKEPVDYRKFFLKTGFAGGTTGLTADPTTILENWNARGLISEREYLDAKYEMDLASAAKNADARMKIETQYYKDLQSLRINDIQSYLNAASQGLSAITSLIEASKQKELSAAGDNAKRRARIEEDYLQKQKGWAIAQAIINGALAVTNLIASVPLSVLNPATWVGIGIAAAATAAQVAIIAGQGMAGGGIVPSGYPNDTYPAMLTSGETVTPPNKLSNISRQNDNMPREVLIKFQNGSLEGYINYNARKQASYS